MFSRHQFQILTVDHNVLYFDATGGVLFKPRDAPACKILYVFLFLENSNFVPIAEVISGKHDAHIIGTRVELHS